VKWSNVQIAEKRSLKIVLYTVTCVGLLFAKNAEPPEGWLKVKSVETKEGLRVLRELKPVLGPGEGEVIALTMETEADFALTNDEEPKTQPKE